MTVSRLKSGTLLYRQGEPADAVFYIQQGEVTLSVVSEQGKEAIVAIRNAGDLCGEGCLSGQTLRISTATIMSKSIIARLEKASVVRAMHDDQAFCDFLIAYLLTQNVRLNEHLIDHLFNSSEKRLARALLLLANYGKETRTDQIVPKIDQMTLAKLIGTTRSRVNYFMNKFRKLGYIDYNGRINVHSSLLNVVLHDSPLDVEEPASRSASIAKR